MASDGCEYCDSIVFARTPFFFFGGKLLIRRFEDSSEFPAQNRSCPSKRQLEPQLIQDCQNWYTIENSWCSIRNRKFDLDPCSVNRTSVGQGDLWRTSQAGSDAENRLKGLKVRTCKNGHSELKRHARISFVFKAEPMPKSPALLQLW